MARRRRVERRPRAQLDVLEQATYLGEEATEEVALRFVDAVDAAFQRLADTPEIGRLRELEQTVLALQEAFQRKEREFAHIVKIARTQLQDAVLITLGREMSAYAEAFSRDRWRIYKCEERLRVVNLGGTAIGTGVAAPREYIFRVVDQLREITGFGLARAENLVEATQNADVFVEVQRLQHSDRQLRRANLWSLAQLVLGEHAGGSKRSLSWRALASQNLGVAPEVALTEIFGQRVAVEAPSWQRLADAVIVARLKGPESLDPVIGPRRAVLRKVISQSVDAHRGPGRPWAHPATAV